MFIPLLVGTIMYVGMWALRSFFRNDYTRVQYPIWLRCRVHISVNVLRRVAAKLAVHSAINVIIWPFSILSRIPIVGIGYCINTFAVPQVQGDWKYLRRAFKKMDIANEGFVTLPQFRSVLKLGHIELSDDEVYQLMNRFDENMTGNVAYNQFLNDTFTTLIPSRESAVRHSAEL